MEPQTGKTSPYSFTRREKGIIADFSLPPCGSLLLFLSKDERESAAAVALTTATIAPLASPTVTRTESNVLTLDYVDVTAGGETLKDIYFYPAAQFAFKKNGIERNPWDSSVQFRDELIKHTFPAGSGCEVSYRFTIEGEVPKAIGIVIERPDLYSISCNGKPLQYDGKSWWLDKSFGRMNITSLVQPGENTVKLQACPFTMYHEIEPAYITGDFALKPSSRGFVIVADHGLKLGPWKEQGHPFYGSGVAYSERFNLSKVAGRYAVSLPSWYGCVAKVQVNGQTAGYIQCQPWECDVTDFVKAGENAITIVVYGTLKNTLGPHHNNPPLGIAGPGSFREAPNPGPPSADKYSSVNYGLYEPFVLKHKGAQ